VPDHSLVENMVRRALAEDVGAGDLTAGLIAADRKCHAQVLCRQDAVLCGCTWFDETFRQLDPQVRIDWRVRDDETLHENQILCQLRGPARAVLTGERTALNFVQTLSGTATVTRRYADQLRGTRARLLDTRKTLPGWRLAQKYAVRCGGGHNHRTGLYDGILIKENHIRTARSITAVLAAAKAVAPAGILLEIEVRDLAEMREALAAGAQHILLDNFDLESLRTAVAETAGRAELEASGGVGLTTIRAVAETGVDYISVGAITKNIEAVDLSMQFEWDDPPATPSR
jgi:nicotinate-nucleotide pyrophosphorylase (carboxylating)